MSNHAILTGRERSLIGSVSGLQEILGAGGETGEYNPVKAARLLRTTLGEKRFENLELLDRAMERMYVEDQVRVMGLILDVSKKAARKAKLARAQDPTLGLKVDAQYPFGDASHEGPSLRRALGMSERGFRKLCRRSRVRGKASVGMPTVFSRREVEVLIKRRAASMSQVRREEFRRQLATTGFRLRLS